jgi:glutamyl-Q tRNA(Asp) synthetase
MEDLDTPRVIPGCADEMLRTLESFGLHWDGAVEFQSRRLPMYVESLQALRARGLTFECSCSRRELSHSETGYPGTCRSGPSRSCGSTATRFRVDDSMMLFQDRIQGECQIDLRALGDPVIRRRDGVFAYQLAVVVDDAAQGVSDVVRGADLLPSTAWQIQLQRALELPTPSYAHLPLVLENNNQKLAKSRRSLAIDPAQASSQLYEALSLLKHNPPPQLAHAPPGELLAWATSNWSLDTVQGMKEIVVFAQMSHV